MTVGQVRGVLAERVIVSIPLDSFLPLKALATYSGLDCARLVELPEKIAENKGTDFLTGLEMAKNEQIEMVERVAAFNRNINAT